jgi:hypothetical protein
MAKSPHWFLPQQLRARADAVAAKRVRQLEPSPALVDRVDQRMLHVFEYFDEACRPLQVITPLVARPFELPHVARYEGLHVERASVTLRKQRLRERDVKALDLRVNCLLAKPGQLLLRAPLGGFSPR